MAGSAAAQATLLRLRPDFAAKWNMVGRAAAVVMPGLFGFVWFSQRAMHKCAEAHAPYAAAGS